MYKLHPYFTNDGTVGLFSPEDDDVYHSTYGAISESWQKFVLPAGLADYIDKNDSVKILDICYGIGYNTKAVMNVFVENVLTNLKNNESSQEDIEAIDSDNIFTSKMINLFKKKLKKKCKFKNSIVAIGSDNIAKENENM